MQSIKEKLEKSKWVGHLLGFFQKYVEYGRFVFVFLIIVLVGTGAFLTGRLMMTFETREPIDFVQNASVISTSIPNSNTLQNQNKPVNISNTQANKPENATVSSTPGAYVASKTGKAYYFPWCATAKRIKEANRVWFGTKAAAEAAGYKPAANCNGLK